MAQSLQNAPFIKGTLYLTAGASIFAQAVRATPRSGPALVQAACRVAAFQSPGELVFGVFLIYYFRVLERQAGTARFAAFATVVTGLASVIQAALTRLLRLNSLPVSGPYGFIFACLVQFALNIPASSKFTIAGFRLSDKTFTYLAGLQLLLSGGRPTLVASAAGAIAGCLYKINFLGIKKLRFPASVSRFFSSTLGVLLRDSQPQDPAAGRASRGSGRQGPQQQQQGQGPGAPGQPGQARQARPAPQQADVPPPSEDALQRLMEMGFERSQAALALQATNNNVDMAISLLVG